MRHRICIDCRYVNGRSSGIAELVSALARFVPHLAPEYDFTLLVSPSAPGPLSRAANVTQVPLAAAPNGPATMWFLPQVADLAGIDLFHAPANILPAGLPMPTVTTVHDLMWLEQPQWCSPGLLHPLRRAFYSAGIARALRKSTAIAAVSVATASAIGRCMPEASARTFVTFPGVSTDFAPVTRDGNALAACGLDPARRYVLVVGQYAPYKNHFGAVGAFARACRDIPDIDLVIVQRQGRAANDLLTRARQLGLQGRVRLPGPVGRSELVLLYASAAVLLHPSFCEGFGNPVAEAMACGCPVVTSNISAMPEVSGGAALLADPADEDALARQLQAVLGNPALAEDLRQRGLARASALRWKEFAAANLALYRRVLGRG